MRRRLWEIYWRQRPFAAGSPVQENIGRKKPRVANPGPRTILVPVDFSTTATETLAHAVALAKATTGRVTLLHVLPPLTTPRRRPLVVSREKVEAGEGARAQLVQLAASEMRGRGPVALHVLVGDAAEQIVESAARSGTNLIVVGTHGRGALGRLLPGSTAKNIVRHAPPAVVYRETIFPGGAVSSLNGARRASHEMVHQGRFFAGNRGGGGEVGRSEPRLFPSDDFFRVVRMIRTQHLREKLFLSAP